VGIESTSETASGATWAGDRDQSGGAVAAAAAPGGGTTGGAHEEAPMKMEEDMAILRRRGAIAHPDLGQEAETEIDMRGVMTLIITVLGAWDTRAIRTGRRANNFPHDAAARTTMIGGRGVASR
jgi:hypothetical protein